MFRYKLHYADGSLHYADGSEAGDAAYADWVNVGETIMLGPGNTGRADGQHLLHVLEHAEKAQSPLRRGSPVLLNGHQR